MFVECGGDLHTERYNLCLQRNERSDELRKNLERHRFHVNKLEAVMRMVDNDAIDLDEVCGFEKLKHTIIGMCTKINCFSLRLKLHLFI